MKKSRQRNERDWPHWQDLELEQVVKIWQEAYNDDGRLVERHQKFPVDTRHQEAMTTKVDCATKIAAYLANEASHDELVQWADAALVEEDFPAEDGRALLAVLSQLSASRAPGFLFRVEEYQELLRELGFRLETRLVPA